MAIRGRCGEALAGVIWVVLAVACNVYDKDYQSNTEASKMSNKPDSGLKRPAGTGGKNSDTSEADAAGDGVGSGGTVVLPAGGSKADGSDGTTARPFCGDGIVSYEAGEKCDVMIAKGKAGACPEGPADCPPIDPNCGSWIIQGTGSCKAECVRSEVPCKNGDNCCPSTCTSANDSDCSSECGDGIVQKEKGEVCEFALDGRSAPEGGPVCPTKCEKSKDPCIDMKLTGKAENCTAVCKPVPITAPISGDGCCPPAANANQDTDCNPVCGNKIQEKGEDCDGTSNCNTHCRNTETEEQRKCLETYNWTSNKDCNKCLCTNCLEQSLACATGGDDAINKACDAVTDCGFTSGCIGEACYCGDASGLFFYMCFPPFSAGNGPCKSVIESATGAKDPMAVQQNLNTKGTVLWRAQQVSDCFDTQCKAICEN
jgi:hypothetical protein